MRHNVNQLRTRLEHIFQTHRATADEAAVFADVLIEAELRGRPTHGLNRVKGICQTLDKRPHTMPEIRAERGPLVQIDGAGQSGYLVANLMATHAIRVAHTEGHALVGARNTTHCGMLGYYTARIAQNGLIALAMADCAPMITPWGAADAVFGTNPISAAFPHKPWPILVDMGTCAVTYGALDQARRTGQQIPEHSALDADGNLTTDPHRAAVVLPFGGHRGSALALLIQIFSGIIVGADAMPRSGENYGIFLLALKPDLFAPPEHYNSGIAQIINAVKSARPLQANTEALIPGERAFRERTRQIKEGIEISAEIEKELDLMD